MWSRLFCHSWVFASSSIDFTQLESAALRGYLLWYRVRENEVGRTQPPLTSNQMVNLYGQSKPTLLQLDLLQIPAFIRLDAPCP